MNKKTCFVIMPFSDKEPSGGNKWDDLFDNNIKPAVEGAGLNYQCIRSLNPVGNFMLDIVSKLATAEVVIAVLTELRPNVMYELGIRNALRRKTIMLAESMNDVPSDLKAYIALEYSTKTEDTRKELTRIIREKLAVLDIEEPKSDNPVSDYLRDRAQDICDEWHENKNFETFLPRLKEVLPSYALRLESVLSKVSQHISELTARAAKNAEAIGQKQPEETTPEVQKEAGVVARAGEALQTLNVQLTPAILRNMAFDAFNRDEFEDVLTLSNQLLGLDPKDSLVWNLRGDALLHFEKHDEALESFEKAGRLNPKSALSWANRGIVLSNLGRYAEAVESANKAIKLDPRRPSTWSSQGRAFFFLRRFTESAKSFGQAFKLEPTNAPCINNKGFALEADGKIEAALKCYEQALTLNPENPHAHYNRGSALKKLGKDKEAKEAVARALAIDPKVGDEIEGQKRLITPKS